MKIARYIWFVFFIPIMLSAQEKQKKTEEELREIESATARSFEERDFQRALEGYSLLYEETSDSELLFKIGQCQRFLNQYTKATSSYHLYLEAQPEAPRQRAVQEVVVEMKEKLEKQAEERRRAKRRNLLISGGLLLSSGATAILATQQEDEKRALALGTTAGLSLVLSGVFLTVALRPKPPLYTINVDPAPSTACLGSERFGVRSAVAGD